MFMMMLIAAGTLLQAYVFWRAGSVPAIARRVPRALITGLGVVLWAGLFLAFYLGRDASGTLARLLELFAMTWLAMLFLAFVVLFAVDLITGFGLWLPRYAPRLRGWALVAAGVLSVIALVQGIRPPVVRDYEVRLAGLPTAMEGTVLVAVSDLHLGSTLGEAWLAARVAQVQALRPDMVILLGDLLEGHGGPEDGLLADLRHLSAPLGVWAVTGNHESHRGRGTSARLLEATGFQVLHDRWAEVRPGLILAGVDDLTSRRRSGQGGDPVREALAGRPSGATILLSHTPWEAEEAAGAGVGLMLCGHTHGGQIWPFDYLVRTVYPLLAGRYEVDEMPVIVCRGTGTWGPRMRLWRPSEILRVTLRRAEPTTPEYEVYAIRYATITGFSVADLVAGADPSQRVDIAMSVWLLKGARGKNVLVDTGFYREELLKKWPVKDFVRPSEALAKVGLKAPDISDVIITHMHWDHAGGVALFPNAHVWIQRDEWDYYSDPARQTEGIAPADVAALEKIRNKGWLTLVEGDARDVIPGISLYLGGRHTYASQYVGVNTKVGTVVVASDAVYLYENLDKRLPIAQTFDAKANLEAQDRMKTIASDPRLIVPGHDPEVFVRFPKPGNGVARIDAKPAP